jgi:hypothetical protein
VSRYGVVLDLVTRRPISGALIELAGSRATTTSDGWYQINLGCPAGGFIGFNTTFIYVSHPEYANRMVGVGRGVSGAHRDDIELGHRSRPVTYSPKWSRALREQQLAEGGATPARATC